MHVLTQFPVPKQPAVDPVDPALKEMCESIALGKPLSSIATLDEAKAMTEQFAKITKRKFEEHIYNECQKKLKRMSVDEQIAFLNS